MTRLLFTSLWAIVATLATVASARAVARPLVEVSQLVQSDHSYEPYASDYKSYGYDSYSYKPYELYSEYKLYGYEPHDSHYDSHYEPYGHEHKYDYEPHYDHKDYKP
ncbi:hypothetical protein THASP1DRAFT_33137, partial [Thamnocephalis sphaerospora]